MERVTWLVPIVTRAVVGGAAESETGVGSLGSDFTMDGPTLNITGDIERLLHVLDVKLVLCCELISCIICNIVVLNHSYGLASVERDN